MIKHSWNNVNLTSNVIDFHWRTMAKDSVGIIILKLCLLHLFSFSNPTNIATCTYSFFGDCLCHNAILVWFPAYWHCQQTQLKWKELQTNAIFTYKTCFLEVSYRLFDSLVVECWHRVREVPGSIPSQGPRHTKDVIKMVPVVPLFSTQHWKGKYWLFLKN